MYQKKAAKKVSEKVPEKIIKKVSGTGDENKNNACNYISSVEFCFVGNIGRLREKYRDSERSG
jgi:hypothetical protein